MSGPCCQAYEGRCKHPAETVQIIRGEPRLACRKDSGPSGAQWYGPAPGVNLADLSEELLEQWAAAERAHQRTLRRQLRETEAALEASQARERAIEAQQSRQLALTLDGT